LLPCFTQWEILQNILSRVALFGQSGLLVVVTLFVDGDFIPLAILDDKIFHHIADAAVVVLCRLFQSFSNFR
jgi:hypothetical protein